MRERRAQFVLVAMCAFFCLCAPEAFAQSTNPFSGLQTKIQDMVNIFVAVIRVILGGLLVWGAVDFARGNGQAWLKFGGAILGLVIVSQHEAIVTFFTS